VLLHNVSRTPGHWITLQLRGKGPNGQAYGARVIGRAGGQIWVGQVSPASSYLSSADPRIHFGLGETAKLEQLEVRWPDGRMQTFASVEGDRIQVATEGENALRSLPAAGSQVRQ
jgi:hypothetical protein